MVYLKLLKNILFFGNRFEGLSRLEICEQDARTTNSVIAINVGYMLGVRVGLTSRSCVSPDALRIQVDSIAIDVDYI